LYNLNYLTMKHNAIKLFLFIVLCSTVFAFSACRKLSHYKYTGTVISKGTDCGETYIIKVDQKIKNVDNKWDIFYADQLPDKYKNDGVEIKFNCRKPLDSELYPCTCLGIGYNHIIITEIEEK